MNIENIKIKFHNFYDIKKSIEKFPLTILTVFLVTLISVIYKHLNQNIILFSIYFGIGTFFSETVSKSKSKRRILYYVLSGIVAGAFIYLQNIEGTFLNMENQIFLNRLMRVILCYCISMISLSIYFNYKNSKKSFEEYIVHIFSSVLKTSIIYGLISLGMLLITSVFVLLILGGFGYTLILKVEILLLGFYFIPKTIYSFHYEDKETSEFIKVVIKYVLGTLVILAFSIIYIYIAKIIIFRDVPSNQIFRILATLFIIGLPIWTMVEKFKGEDFLSKINKKLPLLFAPFILLQVYSIGVRIIDNGITPLRYVCIMLIIFEIIYIIMYLKNKEKIGNILVVFTVFTVVSSIVPFINMFKVSEISQYNNLKIYKEKTEYTQKEKDKIKGAYKYFVELDIGKEYISKLLTQEDITTILSFSNVKNASITTNIQYISISRELNGLNIEGYKNIYMVSDSNYNVNLSKESVFKNVSFNIENSNDYINVNMVSNIENYINQSKVSKNISEYPQENYEVQIDYNNKIVICYLYVQYDLANDRIKSYSIEGYLLRK